MAGPKRRSQADKIGKHKYELQRMAQIDARLERIEQMQRIIFQGLIWYFRFERPLIEKHGKKWVFTDFGLEIWGKTRGEVETDG